MRQLLLSNKFSGQQAQGNIPVLAVFSFIIFTKKSIMQKGLRSVFLAAFLLLSMAALKAQMSNITFEVDVNGFSGVSAVYITGDANGFDDWCGTCMLMSDPDMDGIYSITVAMAPGTYEYKYNINDWNGTENLVPGSPCTVTNFGFTNRVVTVGTTDFTEGPYCHGTCDTTCSGATLPVQVTFEVDMSNEVVSPAGVFITGQDIDGWCGTCVQMDDPDMDNIFSVTLSMQPGTYEWKYNNGDWNGTETLVPGSPCTMTSGQFTNRVATINNDTTLAHCFETCDIDCSNAATPVNVTFQVDMSNEVVSPAGVFITGQEIDGWCGTCVQMQDPDSNGIYEFTTPLLPGFYEWKYNNGDWAGSETLTAGTPCTFTTDTFTNRAATIGMNDTILPPFCFGSCDITCSPAAPMVDVTFQVDMSEEAISGNGIHLAGSFQGWDPAATPMTHMGNGIFEATVSVMANATHDYLFVNGNVMNAAEEVPLACGVYDGTGGYNRSVIVGGSDMTLAEVCFASCDTCMAAPICQQPVGVTWSNVTSTGATISWSLEPDALVTQLQYSATI